MKNRKSEKQGQSLYRKMGKVFALFAVLAGAALIQESMNPVLKQGNVLERQAYGDGNYDAELIWEIPEKELEQELLAAINQLGIGPGGLGGRMTALAVNIETFATHIAGLPVAVNICCHVNRHAHRVL